ncbi:MAG: hypothetical protein JXL97_10035 [Bacteroidales bacterium]|nr:hypothetical protein [Bacteroidales bacterium]
MKKYYIIFIFLLFALNSFSQARQQEVYKGGVKLGNTGAIYLRNFNVSLYEDFKLLDRRREYKYRWKVRLIADHSYLIALYIPFEFKVHDGVKIQLSEDRRGKKIINEISIDSDFSYFNFNCTQSGSYFISIAALEQYGAYAIGYLGIVLPKKEE